MRVYVVALILTCAVSPALPAGPQPGSLARLAAGLQASDDSAERQMPLVIAPASFSLSIGLASTFHSLGDYAQLVQQLYRADTTGAFHGINANSLKNFNVGVQFSLRIHLSEHWHLGAAAHHHFTKRDARVDSDYEKHHYLRLAAVELFYVPLRRKIRPWVSAGFASTAIFLKDYQQRPLDDGGTLQGVEWGTTAHTISLGMGLRHYLAPKGGYDLALRFFPFGSQKIRRIYGGRYSYEELPAGALASSRMNLAMFTLSFSYFGTI